jgi:glutamyl-tRNA synthetase
MIVDVGIKPNDVTLSWETFSYNRKILDATSNRYFFVAQPTELKVKGVPKAFQAKLPLHSEHPERGFREYSVVPEGVEKAVGLWISQKDAQAMELEQTIRLMELFNIKIQKETDNCVTAVYKSESYEDVRKIKVQLIQWIPKGAEYPTQVINQDASITEGFAESDCKKLKPDAIIQFERFGFVHVTEVGEKLVVYYSQK